MRRREVKSRTRINAALLLVVIGLPLSGCALGRDAGKGKFSEASRADKSSALERAQVSTAATATAANGVGKENWPAAASSGQPYNAQSGSTADLRLPMQLPAIAASTNATSLAADQEVPISSGSPAIVASHAAPAVVRPSVLHVNESNFEQQVLQSDVPVLVDFYAEWCGPCKKLGPVLDELAVESPQAKVVKVNIDDCRQLAARYRVSSVPNLQVFKGGRAVARQEGLASKSRLKSMLEL
jgi:thioredoxin 1